MLSYGLRIAAVFAAFTACAGLRVGGSIATHHSHYYALRSPSPSCMAKIAKQGLFSPVVKGAAAVMGQEELNKLRGQVIAAHTKVISAFVDTHESKFGQIALKTLFDAADKDGNGTLDKDEIKAALNALGFSHLKEKQIDGIVSRADVDENEVIDFEEFVKETPKTLRTNLITLA